MTNDSLRLRRDLLAAVLDTLVPEGEGFPGAGAVAVDHVLALAAASAELERVLGDGLVAVEETARTVGAGGFASLGADDRESLLRRIERTHPAFFESLVRHTYDGYYSHPAVVTQLGLDPRPLHPRGHRIEAGDLPELARVTARGPIYRPT